MMWFARRYRGGRWPGGGVTGRPDASRDAAVPVVRPDASRYTVRPSLDEVPVPVVRPDASRNTERPEASVLLVPIVRPDASRYTCRPDAFLSLVPVVRPEASRYTVRPVPSVVDVPVVRPEASRYTVRPPASVVAVPVVRPEASRATLLDGACAEANAIGNAVGDASSNRPSSAAWVREKRVGVVMSRKPPSASGDRVQGVVQPIPPAGDAIAAQRDQEYTGGVTTRRDAASPRVGIVRCNGDGTIQPLRP
jgi:hypothetical protein